jgi:carbonic anhydrase
MLHFHYAREGEVEGLARQIQADVHASKCEVGVLGVLGVLASSATLKRYAITAKF